jgi:hypothetical protein
MYNEMSLYKVYFVSKGTRPMNIEIEAQNSAGAKAQVESRYPGAYNIPVPRSSVLKEWRNFEEIFLAEDHC